MPAAVKVLDKADLVSGGAEAFLSTDILESASRTIREPLRNETGSSIPKGTLVAITGFNLTENRPTVIVADKDDSTKRPAVAVTEAAIGNNTNFDGLVVGTLKGLNTSAFSANDQLALGNSGAVSRPPPDTDPFTGEIQLVGSVVRSDASNGSIYFTLSSGLLPMTAAHFFAARETAPTGNVNGGEVTRVSGLNVAVAAGNGFVNDGTDVFRVPYSAVSSLALAASDTNFIFVDKNGLVQASTSLPALGNNIVLADAITNGTTVLLLANHQVLLTERPALFHDYAKDVVGNVTVSGLTTSQATAALRVKVDSGTFYTRDFRVTVPATDPVTFTYWFRDGSGGFTRVAGSTLIDKDNFDDGSGTLVALLTTEFKKDLLFVVFTAASTVEYHVFYGQEKFTSQALAETGNLPAADSDVIANGIRSAGIVIEGAAAVIASFVDVRPFLGQLAPPVTSVSDHGLLSGLSDDDHPQYLLVTGARPMTGPLDMGANAISNVGNVDGVDVSAHTARHADGGADELPVASQAEAAAPGNDVSQALRPDGTGGVAFSDIDHADVTGTAPIAKGGTGQTTQTAAFDALAPTTTKGDVIAHDGTDNVRLPVGTNDQVLTADSGEASGVKWAAAGGAVSQLASWDANDAIFPATNPAAATSRNGHPVLAFDPTTAESVILNDVMSRDYSAGSIMVDIDWVAATATTGDSVWGVEVERTAPGGNDIDTDSFAAQQTGTSTTNAASGVSTRTTITLTQAQADAIAAGDAFRLRVQRVAADGGDTMTGDAQILRINVRQ